MRKFLGVFVVALLVCGSAIAQQNQPSPSDIPAVQTATAQTVVQPTAEAPPMTVVGVPMNPSDCGCGAPAVSNCGCSAPCASSDCGCDCERRQVFARLRNRNNCPTSTCCPAPAQNCGCSAPVAATPCCGCSAPVVATPCCGSAQVVAAPCCDSAPANDCCSTTRNTRVRNMFPVRTNSSRGLFRNRGC